MRNALSHTKFRTLPRHSDYRGDRDDASTLALLEVGGIEPQIRPFAGERAVEEGANPIVDILAQLAHHALADPRHPSIGAVLMECNDEWAVQTRYMQVEAMVELLAPTTDTEPAQITANAA